MAYRHHETPPFSLLLLYGGAGRRFGGDKGLAEFRGESLVARLLRRMSGISDDVFISSNAPESYAPLGLRVIPDETPGLGPLGGLQAGLKAARHDLLALVAGDMPFASPELFRYLASEIGDADVIVPTHGTARRAGPRRGGRKQAISSADALGGTDTSGSPDTPTRTDTPPNSGDEGNRPIFFEPLHALYHRRCLPAIEATIAAHQRKITDVYPRARVRAVPESSWARVVGAAELVFANANTPEELVCLEGTNAEGLRRGSRKRS
ncbi:MAG: molybdenum cofactor guanylyltransferase [Candidatus Eisenbacteria sp.]|nr:molybdenum cofactor guanylyltransferase [Candidatus Eisenbacteria bacterium]